MRPRTVPPQELCSQGGAERVPPIEPGEGAVDERPLHDTPYANHASSAADVGILIGSLNGDSETGVGELYSPERFTSGARAL